MTEHHRDRAAGVGGGMRILQGDCLETLKTLDAGIVQICVTSPPYYGLRDYGMDAQIGLEETPDAYVDKLVRVFREVKRVLKDDGTLWLNLGDSYCNTNGFARAKQEWQQKGRNDAPANDRDLSSLHAAGYKTKDLLGIPWMVAFALRADGWYLRSDIIWHKPNPMPESVRDRPTKSHEYIFLLSKNKRYYYDADAIAEPSAWAGDPRAGYGRLHYRGKREGQKGTGQENFVSISETRNKRSVWTVTTKPYSGAHFATFPPDLIEPCILAGSKAGDVVLDPFNGSGTTGAVALKHHRDYIGCELNPEYIELTNQRIKQVQSVLLLAPQTGQTQKG